MKFNKIVLLTCCCFVANTLNAQEPYDYSKWDLRNEPSDYMEKRAWEKERQKFVVTIVIRNQGGTDRSIDLPLENGEIKKGVFENQIRSIYKDSRKIWFTTELGCSPGFFKSIAKKFEPFILLSDRQLVIFQDPMKDAAITNFEIDPSIIKKSLHFYTELLDKSSVPDVEIVRLKNSVVSFVRHIQPISEEDGTFEAVYDESPYKIFSKENDALRRSAFYPITREDMMSVADVCLNEVSPFDEDEKEEIRQAFVEKGFLSA